MTKAERELYEQAMIKRITIVVRQADKDFEKAGGTSLHWVRDHFLPVLQEAGLKVVKQKGTK